MIVWAGGEMDERIRAAYIDHVLDLARRGIIDDDLTDVDIVGRTVEERMVDALRSAGKLPPELEQELLERQTA